MSPLGPRAHLEVTHAMNPLFRLHCSQLPANRMPTGALDLRLPACPAPLPRHPTVARQIPRPRVHHTVAHAMHHPAARPTSDRSHAEPASPRALGMVAHSLERVIREPSLGFPGDGRLLRTHQIVSHPMNPLPREPYPQFPARMTRFGSLATQLPMPLELACAHSPCSCPRREVVSAHSPRSFPRDELRATLLTVQSPAR